MFIHLYLQTFIAVSHRSGFSYTINYWTLTGTLPYPVVALFCGEPAALDQQVRSKAGPLQAAQQFIDGPNQSPGSGAVPHPQHLGERSSTGPAGSSNAASGEGRGQLSSSPAPPLLDHPHLCHHLDLASQWRCRAHLPNAAASKGQGQLSCSHDLGASSPACHRW